ncbi:MAG: hypothetical protein WBR21_05885 [Rouxiella badensis]|uniref:hypothetical protein n=1 Tax=Rouxiella badensis TaxID=1646377 RepID=UPI003C490EE9
MSGRFSNSKSQGFLASLAQLVSLDDVACKLSERCKFNFSYLDSSQAFSSSFDDLDPEELIKFINKLHEYCKFSLDYWKTVGVGKKRNGALAIYGAFPPHSEFTKPTYIPHQASWGRFRMDGTTRLAGFVIPDEYNEIKHKGTSYLYDSNTFYVVFIDREHKFYPVK